MKWKEKKGNIVYNFDSFRQPEQSCHVGIYVQHSKHKIILFCEYRMMLDNYLAIGGSYRRW